MKICVGHKKLSDFAAGFTTGDGSTLIRAMDAALAQDENQQPAEGSSTAAARVSNASHTRSAGGNEEDEETQNPSEEGVSSRW